ncbi:MAG: glyoxalase [Opitutus sp.]|nr:glyoxalase [Opitutus sp.]
MSATPVIEGIVETVLYTDDLPRAVTFYRDVLGLPPIAGDGVRFRALKVSGRQVLLLFRRGATSEPMAVPSGGTIPPHDGSGPHHLGFAITHDAYEPWLARLRAAGVAIESEAKWDRGGRSLYFRDPDGHMLELLTPGLWPNY